jgi:hypothetical protein
MRLADYPRALNRARINALFNGAPPYSPEEQRDNNINTNVNDLSATNIDLTARRQYDSAIIAPEPLFNVSLDYGPGYKRFEWSSKITKKINKRLINNAQFLDLRQGVFAVVVLHGPGCAGWADRFKWRQTQYGVEDILIPSNTNRGLDNLPFFAIYRSYTVNQLWKLAKCPMPDPGWNMDVVNGVLKWADKQAETLLGQTWPEVWSPEKMEERFKQDSGLYASDAVPSVDCYDFYFWNDDGEEEGWRRRIILDAWGQPGSGAITEAQYKGSVNSAKDSRRKGYEFGRNKFLYDSGDRIYADSLEKILHFQFGDASSVAPFKYHSIRSLGFLMYAVCHLQNRLKCRFNDAVFESLMQYFRVNNPADMDRLQKVDLINYGFLPEGLDFVKPEERWKYDAALATEAIDMNRQSMADQSMAYSQDSSSNERGEYETATRTMAKVNSAASIVGATMNMAYAREKFRYLEICRRFCMPNSPDKDVRDVRLELLKEGVPEAALDVNKWDLQINRALGGGNKMMEVAIAEKLMAVRAAHPPEGQQRILKIYDAAVTGDYALAESLTPDMPRVTDSMHDSELTFGSLMAGGAVTPRPGLNPIEVIETMLKLIGAKIQQILSTDGMGKPEDVAGLDAAIQYTTGFSDQLAQDKEQQARVKEYNDALGKASNEVKGMGQRQQEAAQQAQSQNGQMSPEDQAKIQAMILQSETKAQLASESHAQKTAQRQLQFEQQMKQQSEKHMAELLQTSAQGAHEHRVDLAVEMNKPKPAPTESKP